MNLNIQDLTIFVLSFIYLFGIIDDVVLNTYLELAANAADVNPNGTSRFFTGAVSTFFIDCKPILVNRPRILPRNPPYCLILKIYALVVLY